MSLYFQIKRLLVGDPLPTSASEEEKLSNAAGLAVLSSDALSSVAYATEEILVVLIAAGSAALKWSIPIAIAIITLLAVVVLSYRQTIRAYPKGGGSYIVAKENLGLIPGLVAGASLMIDYILTVTVSVSAGTAALTSAVPFLRPYTEILCLIFIILLMIANLRGVRASGNLFMIPTYTFVLCIFFLIVCGLYRHLTGQIPTTIPSIPGTQSITLFLILRAFAAGCAALTGVEAISDGILAFKKPEWQNARITLTWMGVLLGFMFLGITYLVNVYHIVPEEGQTAVSLLGRQILGIGPVYYFIQTATLLILLLAANTSFADFPRLCYFLSRDGFLPRQLSLLGDRLVYSNGVILLSICAIVLVFIFRGDTSAIIPLYAVGVFTSFTLSQAGMVVHWFKEKSKNWQFSAVMNALGALTTLIVLGVIVSTKFLLGAWSVVVTIPLVMALFLNISSHYRYVAIRLKSRKLRPIPHPRPRGSIVYSPAVVLVGSVHRGSVEALEYACSIADEVVAIHVDVGTTNREELMEDWKKLNTPIQLIFLDSPYRSAISPIVDFITQFEAKRANVFCTIIIPTFVPRNWWEELLHNQTALFLRAALRSNRSRVISTVRFYL